jgi:hypothetical protein
MVEISLELPTKDYCFLPVLGSEYFEAGYAGIVRRGQLLERATPLSCACDEACNRLAQTKKVNILSQMFPVVRRIVDAEQKPEQIVKWRRYHGEHCVV